MNYEKKYQKLVDAVKVLRDNNPSDEGIQNWVNDNVPELKESEDERIIKGIKAALKFEFNDGCRIAPGTDVTREEALEWLDKQCGQKSVEWSEEDEEMLNVIDTLIWYHLAETENGKYEYSEWLKSLKQRME